MNPSAPSKQANKGPGPNPLEMAGRFLFILGTIAAFGGAIVRVAAYRRADLRGFVRVAAAVGIVGVVVLGIAQHSATHALWSVLFRLPIGRALIERLVALAFVLAFTAIGEWGFTVAVVFAAGAMVADVFAGHAAATSSWIGGPPLQIAAQTVHFATAAVWMGGLGALLFAIRGAHSEEKSDAVLRYSRLAAVSLFAVGITGLYRAIGAISSWQGLFHSGYGYLVIAKTALFVCLAGLGARQRFWNLDKIRTTLDGLRRVGTAELTVAVGLFVATAMLMGLSPPPPALAADAPLVADGTDLGHAVKAHLVITPGQAGINTFTATLKTAVRPETVRLRFAYEGSQPIGPSELALRRHGDAWRASAANLSIEGLWSITLTAQSATTSAEVPLEVATHCDTDATAGPKNLILYAQTLSGGDSDTMYLDPGRAGRNEIHFTFFDTKGNELPIPDAPTITVWRPGTHVRGLAVRRFSAGHFIASARLGRGTWRFAADAVPKGAANTLRACFEQTI